MDVQYMNVAGMALSVFSMMHGIVYVCTSCTHSLHSTTNCFMMLVMAMLMLMHDDANHGVVK